MIEMPGAIELVCSGCGEAMYTTGSRGLCPQCLLATTTGITIETPGGSPDAAAEETLQYGVMVGAGGRFLLLDKLGEGGMGEVWLAKDQELSRPGADHLVALKFISKAVRSDARALASIREEVLSSQALSHPNIVRIFDLHVTHSGMPFIKMEYVDGNSLRQWLKNSPAGLMPWPMVSELTHQLAGALLYAHESVKIVHRDLKPGNLLLSRGRIVKLSDFGIATAIAAEGTGRSVGTPLYASPQQLSGAAPTPADDIYSLGATLYELLTGTPPFTARTSAELLHKIQSEPPDPIPRRLENLGRENRVPAKMLLLVHRCLEKNPAYRPRTQELEHLLPPVMQEPQGAVWFRPSATPEVHTAPAKNGLGPLAIGAFGLLLLAAGIWGWFTYVNPSRTNAPRATIRTTEDPAAAAATNPPNTTTQAETKPEVKTTDDPQGQPISLTGRLELFIRSASIEKPPHWITISNCATREIVVANDALPEGRLVYTRSLAPGKYQATVKEGAQGRKDKTWEVPVLVDIKAGETNQITAPFVRERLHITTLPTGAWIEWPTDKIGGTNQLSPLVRQFESGLIQFTVTKPGHPHLMTNYLFNPDISTNLHIVLPLTLYPRPGEDWTNSLGMSFRWVDSLALWACATETRKRDFREFVTQTSRNMTGAIFAVTSEGVKPAKLNWEKLGFDQTEDHPVVGVSWVDAMDFCQWLTQSERSQKYLPATLRYELPSTNDFFRLAGNRRFPWGDDPAAIAGNYSGQEADTEGWPSKYWPVIPWIVNDGYHRTAPVASMKANDFGLYHLGGNAAEWCAEQVVCGSSWCDGESPFQTRTNDFRSLDYLATRRIQTLAPHERHDRNGFRLIIHRGAFSSLVQ